MMMAVACHRSCATRLALVGPLLWSAKQQNLITRAILLMNSIATFDGILCVIIHVCHAEIRSLVMARLSRL